MDIIFARCLTEDWLERTFIDVWFWGFREGSTLDLFWEGDSPTVVDWILVIWALGDLSI
jgi:hypothetical protein